MKQSVFLASLCAAVLFMVQPATGQSGNVTAILPCALTYTQPLSANTPAGIHARGYCGIPEDATALFLHIKIGNSVPPGKLYFWPHGESLPQYTQCNYQDAAPPNPVSCHALVRISDGYYNFWVQSTNAVNLSVVVEGYVSP